MLGDAVSMADSLPKGNGDLNVVDISESVHAKSLHTESQPLGRGQMKEEAW